MSSWRLSARSTIGRLLVAHVARLEVDDGQLAVALDDEVVATLDPVPPDRELELLLHGRGHPGRRGLLDGETPEGHFPGGETPLLVLAREEPLGHPGGPERRDEIFLAKRSAPRGVASNIRWTAWWTA